MRFLMDSRKFGILFFIQGGVRISKYFIVNFNKDLGFVAHPSILDGVQNGNQQTEIFVQLRCNVR